MSDKSQQTASQDDQNPFPEWTDGIPEGTVSPLRRTIKEQHARTLKEVIDRVDGWLTLHKCPKRVRQVVISEFEDLVTVEPISDVEIEIFPVSKFDALVEEKLKRGLKASGF
ncbi:MAG: hypothetical protein U9M89_02375 [Patescibacteria group bacterium]|nr:hypothetical protein [Patescibacteria group bacterium]